MDFVQIKLYIISKQGWNGLYVHAKWATPAFAFPSAAGTNLPTPDVPMAKSAGVNDDSNNYFPFF